MNNTSKAPSIVEITSMERSTARESSHGPIDPPTKAISTKTKWKASALSNGQAEKSTAETGRTA